MSNRKASSVARLQKDYLRLKRDPIPLIAAEPSPQNILEWHYVIKGPDGTPYQGGYYHGTLHFPADFPFKPPAIYMQTPNGRFKINTRLCLSISDFHPDTWNPAWSVSTILTGLLSFMLETTPTLGSIDSSHYEREQFAQKSLSYNLRNNTFCELFPEIMLEIKQKLNAKGKMENGKRLQQSSFIHGHDQNRHSLSSFDRTRWQTIGPNLLVLCGLVIFSLLVNYVVKNVNAD